MKAIHYAGDVLLTGSDIADALVLYAEALAKKDTSAAVEIPVRLPDGVVRHVTVLIGPASQIVAVPEDSAEELVDEELVTRFRQSAAALSQSRPVPGGGATLGAYDDYNDYDLP